MNKLTNLTPFNLTILSMLALLATTNVNAGAYKFTILETLGGHSSYATGINNVGQVVGYSYTTENVHHATLWNETSVTDLGTLGGSFSVARGINNAGQIVGLSYDADNTIEHATLWQGATVTKLGNYTNALSINNISQAVGAISDDGFSNEQASVFNGNTIVKLSELWGTDTHAYATDINDIGQIVGDSNKFSNNIHSGIARATLWSGTKVTDLGTLGGDKSYASAINNNGQIVGISDTSNNLEMHAALWSGNTIVDLGTLGGNYSRATDINNLGQVVGLATSNAGQFATLWENGIAIDLNSLDGLNLGGWILTEAVAINDNGWITGNAYNSQIGPRAFLLANDNISNVPEPETYAMFFAGLVIIGSVANKRKRTS